MRRGFAAIKAQVSILEALCGLALFTVSFGPLLRLFVSGTAASYPLRLRGLRGLKELTLLATVVVPLILETAFWLVVVPTIRRFRGPRSR